MTVPGIGVMPVEGRWDAGCWDGDPSQTTASTGLTQVGVWDGNPSLFAFVGTPTQQLKRQAQTALVRDTSGNVLKRQSQTSFVRKP